MWWIIVPAVLLSLIVGFYFGFVVGWNGHLEKATGEAWADEQRAKAEGRETGPSGPAQAR